MAEGPKGRRRSKLERRQVVEETLQPGASVAVIARNNGVNANQVFHWRKLYREGKLGQEEMPAVKLLPVRVSQSNPKEHSGSIYIELHGACVQIVGAVNVECLQIVLETLRR